MANTISKISVDGTIYDVRDDALHTVDNVVVEKSSSHDQNNHLEYWQVGNIVVAYVHKSSTTQANGRLNSNIGTLPKAPDKPLVFPAIVRTGTGEERWIGRLLIGTSGNLSVTQAANMGLPSNTTVWVECVLTYITSE